MARPSALVELVEHFTLVPGKTEFAAGHRQGDPAGLRPDTKFLIWKGRFPRDRGELPDQAVEHVARQAGVPAADIGSYDWVWAPPVSGRRREIGAASYSLATTEDTRRSQIAPPLRQGRAP